METNLQKAKRLVIADAAIKGIELKEDNYFCKMLELAATTDVVKEKLNLDCVIPMLHQIAKCIDDAIENNEDNEKISEIVELMEGIAEDNWMFVRN